MKFWPRCNCGAGWHPARGCQPRWPATEPQPLSILRGPFHVVDHEVFSRPFGLLEFQSELLLYGVEDRRSGNVRSCVRLASTDGHSKCGLVKHKFQMEIEFPVDPGLVDNGAPQNGTELAWKSRRDSSRARSSLRSTVLWRCLLYHKDQAAAGPVRAAPDNPCPD
jgi:hypothetical protein